VGEGGRADRAVEPRALVAHDGRAADPALPADAPLVPRDRRARLRLGEHGQDAGERGLPQARRVLPVRGRDAGPPVGAARRLA
jgi:hypothetical protein